MSSSWWTKPGSSGEALLVPAGVALRAEEDGALVVVHAVDGVAELAAK
jgi:hypothetical protein